jgi:hypothetical protein
MSPKTQAKFTTHPATVTIPELEQSKTAVLNTLASQHSRRSYEYAISRFIAWYCSEPRLTFNRSVVVSYRSFLARISHSPSEWSKEREISGAKNTDSSPAKKTWSIWPCIGDF